MKLLWMDWTLWKPLWVCIENKFSFMVTLKYWAIIDFKTGHVISSSNTILYFQQRSSRFGCSVNIYVLFYLPPSSLQVSSFQVERSTGTARAWAAWPADRAGRSSRRRFPVSTTAKRKWRAQSALISFVTCRSVCRGSLSCILRRKTRSKQSLTTALLQLKARILPYLLRLTLHRQCQRPTAQHPLNRLPLQPRLLFSEFS